jgi:hypothetical protein
MVIGFGQEEQTSLLNLTREEFKKIIGTRLLAKN